MSGDESLLDQSEIEALLGSDDSSKEQKAPSSNPMEMSEYEIRPLSSSGDQPSDEVDIDMIADVDLNVRVELGRSQMYIEDILRLREGAIVPLDKLAGDPVDVYVNGQLMARGEVLVLNDNFCVRISDIIGEEMKDPLADDNQSSSNEE